MSYRDFPSKLRSKFAYRSQLATIQLVSHTLLALSCIYYICNRVSDSRNVPSLKLSAIFCCVLSVIFRYTAGTQVSSVVASLDFTSKSSDYVLNKTGLFATKLSLSTYHCLNSAIYNIQDTESTTLRFLRGKLLEVFVVLQITACCHSSWTNPAAI